MNRASSTELQEFHRFVGEKVANGGVALSPEEILDEWRSLHPDPHALNDDIVAIQEAIDDMERGDLGIPFEEFDREIRARHKFPKAPGLGRCE